MFVGIYKRMKHIHEIWQISSLVLCIKVKVKQIKSGIKRIKKQKRTLEALGLRGIGKEVIHENTPNILGMIKKVEHLVSVSEA